MVYLKGKKKCGMTSFLNQAAERQRGISIRRGFQSLTGKALSSLIKD